MESGGGGGNVLSKRDLADYKIIVIIPSRTCTGTAIKKPKCYIRQFRNQTVSSYRNCSCYLNWPSISLVK